MLSSSLHGLLLGQQTLTVDLSDECIIYVFRKFILFSQYAVIYSIKVSFDWTLTYAIHKVATFTIFVYS